MLSLFSTEDSNHISPPKNPTNSLDIVKPSPVPPYFLLVVPSDCLNASNIWSQQDTITASNFGYSDEFGFSVALHDETIAVGAPDEDSDATGVNGWGADNSAPDSGAVYVFTRDHTGNWTEQAYIKTTNTTPYMNFGLSVALSGDTLAIGANTGVYVFTREDTGVWAERDLIKPSASEVNDHFGQSLALSGDTLIVGAPNEDSDTTGVNGDEANNNASDAGAVYVFMRDANGVWSQQAYLKASNTKADMWFGNSVSLDGDTLAVGAHREDSNSTGVNSEQLNINATNSGAVYLFKRDVSGLWSQHSYIKASNTNAEDEFGWSVGLSGSYLAIGALKESSGSFGINGDQADNSAEGSGAVYLFE